LTSQPRKAGFRPHWPPLPADAYVNRTYVNRMGQQGVIEDELGPTDPGRPAGASHIADWERAMKLLEGHEAPPAVQLELFDD
jgi:hypothetical protein